MALPVFMKSLFSEHSDQSQEGADTQRTGENVLPCQPRLFRARLENIFGKILPERLHKPFLLGSWIVSGTGTAGSDWVSGSVIGPGNDGEMGEIPIC